MADRALSMAREHAPWSSGTPWWVMGIEGVVLVLIGLYFLLAPASASGLLIQLIAAVVLIQALLQIIAALRAAPAGVDPYSMLQTGIAATVGLIVVLRGMLMPTLDLTAARDILGWGLIAYALVGVAGSLLHRGEGESWYSPIVTAILVVVLAITLLTSSESNAVDRLGLLGWIALVGGVILLLLAWRARDRQANA